jgi:PPK2 family polyphosphate:nucleotide phosphotransferase
MNTDRFLYPAQKSLAAHPTLWKQFKNARDRLSTTIEHLSELQERLYADNRHSVLMIFQGMDAAGKDSTIKYVTSGVNPMGFQVFSFKQPTYKELDHNYLWRYWRAMPERGRIGIFNRSYYEEVGVVRVHPEIIEQRNLPHEHIDDEFWEHRFDDIRAMEKHLYTNGTVILKFFLNVSKTEQKARLLRRLNRPDKHWKFDPRDIDERVHWDAHQYAYEEAIRATHCDHAPWHIIPADHRWTMRVIVAEILCERLEQLQLNYPAATGEHKEAVTDALVRLESEED